MANPEHLLNPDYPKNLGDGKNAIAEVDGSIDRLLADAVTTVHANRTLREGQNEDEILRKKVDPTEFWTVYDKVAAKGVPTPDIDKNIGGPEPDWVKAERAEKAEDIQNGPEAVVVYPSMPSSPAEISVPSKATVSPRS